MPSTGSAEPISDILCIVPGPGEAILEKTFPVVNGRIFGTTVAFAKAHQLPVLIATPRTCDEFFRLKMGTGSDYGVIWQLLYDSIKIVYVLKFYLKIWHCYKY